MIGKPKKTQGYVQAKRSEYIFYWSLLILPIIQFCIFYIWVNFNSFTLAFRRYDANGLVAEWVGFDNFKNMFINLSLKGGLLQKSVKLSVKTYFLSLINVPLSLFFSYYVYKKMLGSEFFKVMLFLPSILSVMILAMLYQYFVDTAIPEIANKYFGVEKMTPFLASVDTRYAAAFLFSFVIGFGGNILMYTGAMARIPDSLVEYAKLEGMGAFREFFKITLPLIFPTVGTFFVLGIAGFFTNQLNLFTFFGTGSKGQGVSTVGYYIYCLILDSVGYHSYPEAAAIGLFFTFIIAPVTMLVRYLVNRFDPSDTY